MRRATSAGARGPAGLPSSRVAGVGGEYPCRTTRRQHGPCAPRHRVPGAVGLVRRSGETSGRTDHVLPEESRCSTSTSTRLGRHDRRPRAAPGVDLAHRRPQGRARRSASARPPLGGFYVGLAIAFGIGLTVSSAGSDSGAEFFAGYLTEYRLSVDNLFVFVIIMPSFAVPAIYQHKVLLFGIVLALVLRGIFIAARRRGDRALRVGVLRLRRVPRLHRLQARDGAGSTTSPRIGATGWLEPWSRVLPTTRRVPRREGHHPRSTASASSRRCCSS